MIELTVIIIVTLMLNEVATLAVFGGYISKPITTIFLNIDNQKLRLNLYNPSILHYGKITISDVPFSLLSKYYIEGQGTVPRFSKLHNKIEEYFAIAIEKSIKSPLL